MTVVERYVDIGSKTSGRDTYCRLVQYSARLLWYYGKQCGCESDGFIKKLRALEKQIASARKVLRLGQFVDHLSLAWKQFSQLDHCDKVLEWCRIQASLCRVGYLVSDNYLWALETGLLGSKKRRWAWREHASTFYLGVTLLTALRDVYLLVRILRQRREDARKMGQNGFHSIHMDTGTVAVVLELSRSLLDMWGPLVTLGKVSLSDGQTGALGLLSTLVILTTHIWPRLKNRQ